MVWNKTPKEKEFAIAYQLKTTDLLNEEIASNFGCSAWLVSEISRRYLNDTERKELWTKRARRSKVGSSNPMAGKTGNQHHNSVEESRCNGYLTLFKPTWWTGKTKDSRIGKHIIVYCEHHGLTELPDKHIVHHRDGNVDNNSVDNLEMLSISEHVKLHWRQRKEQRLSSNGVGNSVPEAQATQKGDDIV